MDNRCFPSSLLCRKFKAVEEISFASSVTLPATLNTLPFYQAMVVLIASTSLPIFAMSTDHGGTFHRKVVYLGLYLAAIGNGGVSPAHQSLGLTNLTPMDIVDLVKMVCLQNF